MRQESGDHTGCSGCRKRECVHCVSLWPSESLVQISDDPDRLETKAMRRPSGDQAGERSIRVDPIKRSKAGGLLASAAMVIRQILEFQKRREKTMMSAWRAALGCQPSSL